MIPELSFISGKRYLMKKKSDFYNLNEEFYLQESNIGYHPTKESIFSYFEKHDKPCFISLFFKDDPLFHYSKKTIIPRQKCIASFTGRPLSMILHGNTLNINYVDYLCVAKNYRKKGIAPRIIYTHYVQSRRNKAALVYLFKREGVTTFITPMTAYFTYGFEYEPVPQVSIFNKPILITQSSFQTFYHYIQSIKDDIPCFVCPSFSHLQYLVEKNYYIYFCSRISNKYLVVMYFVILIHIMKIKDS